MIGTVAIKEKQLKHGAFKTGTGKEVILILGSCRSVPYINYLVECNKNDRFTIYFIDPFNWNWDENNNRVDYTEVLSRLETNKELLDVIGSVKIFIHEYYSNAGMFNVFKDKKNIYEFGMNPDIDITIPNFNDVFILFRDIVSFDISIRKKAIQDYNVIGKLSDEVIAEIRELRDKNLAKFYETCFKTDFTEFLEIFKSGYKNKRFFWNINHVAKEFTLNIFRLMNDKFLKLDIPHNTWNTISERDMYDSNFTSLSEYDEGYNWNETIKPLKTIL